MTALNLDIKNFTGKIKFIGHLGIGCGDRAPTVDAVGYWFDAVPPKSIIDAAFEYEDCTAKFNGAPQQHYIELILSCDLAYNTDLTQKKLDAALDMHQQLQTKLGV